MTDPAPSEPRPESAGLVPPELAVSRQAPDRNLALELVRVTEAATQAERAELLSAASRPAG
jgi:hypothetical protein